MTGWNHDMAKAPRDHTLLQLLIRHDEDQAHEGGGFDDGELSRTMGFNGFEHDGVDKWVFPGWCWSNDHIIEQGAGTPVAWALMLPLPVSNPSRTGKAMSAIDDVIAERKRQIEVEGWTPEHDDSHNDESLAAAAGVFALPPSTGPIRFTFWPRSWSRDWLKLKSRRHDLVRAAALIVAEIERLDRTTQSK